METERKPKKTPAGGKSTVGDNRTKAQAGPRSTRTDALTAIQETVFDLVTNHTLPELLNAIVERAATLLNANSGGMYLAESESRQVRCVVSYNTVEDFRGTLLNYGEGVAGRVAETGKPLKVDDYNTWSGRAEVYAEKQAFKAVISVPMSWRGQVIGVVTVLREEKFSREDMKLLGVFANHAAVAVENARLYEAAQKELAERKRAELALQLSEKQYQTLFENMVEGFAYCKMIFSKGKPVDWIYLAVNDAFEKLTGLHNVTGKRVTEIIPGILESDTELFNTYARVSQTGGSEKFEIFLQSLKMWFSVAVYSPHKEHFVAIFDVITERKDAEQAMGRRLAEFKALYENGLAISQLRDPREIANHLMETLVQNLFWHHITIRLKKPNSDEMDLLALHQPGLTKRTKPQVAKRFTSLIHKTGQGLTGWAVQTGQIVRTGNVHDFPQYIETYPGIQSGMYAPLKVGEQVIGCISVESEQANIFTDQDERLLATLANQAAISFENARLYQGIQQELAERTRAEEALRENEKRERELSEVAQRQAQELSLLDKVRNVLAQELELPILLRRVVESISETFGYALVSLYLVEGNELVLQRQVGYERTIPRIALTQGVSGRVASTGKAEFLHNVTSDPDFLEAVDGILSEICIPLFDHGRVAGILNVESRDVRLTDADMHLMLALSEHVGMAISKARLFNYVKRRNQILSALHESALSVMKQTKRTETLHVILAQAGRLMNTSHGYIYLVQPGEDFIEVILGMGRMNRYQGRRLKPNEGLGGKVWVTAQPIAVQDYKTWAGKSTQYEDMPFHAVVGVPLIYDEKVIGVLGLAHIDPERVFSENDVETLGYFSRLASIALENANLFSRAEQELAERKQAEQALRQAETQYRELVERLPLVVYTSELGEDGEWFYVSPQIESLLGYTAQEWMEDRNAWYRQIHPEDRARQEALEEEASRTGQAFESEYRIFTKDGHEIWLRDSGHILPGKQGRPPIVQGVMTNITERKQAQDALRESEERYRLLADTSPSPIFLHQEGRFIFINPSGLKLLGASAPEELIGKPIVEVVHPEYRSIVAQRVQGAISEGKPVPVIEEKFIRLDGSIVDVEVAAASLTLNGKPTMMVIAHDISERKRAEDALRESESLYRRAIEVAGGVPYYQSYDNRNKTHIMFDFIGDGIRQITGYGPEEFTEDLWDSLVQERHIIGELAQYPWREAVERVRSGKASMWKCEFRIRARDGSTRWVFESAIELRDASGISHGSIGLYQDITERKQVEAALRSLEENYRNLVEQIPAVVYQDHIDESASSLYISPQVENMLGYLPSAYRENPTIWHEQIHPDDYQHALSTVSETLEKGRAAEEYRMLAKDGRTLWVRDTSVLIRDESGQPKYIQGLLEDITERKRAERLQASIYEIAHAAMSAQSLDELYFQIHQILQTLLPTQFFYIALYDREKDLLSFPYFQDIYDEASPPGKPGHGLTEYVLRTRQPLLATRAIRSQLIEAGEVQLIGADSIEWLGVPLIVHEEAIGVMVVQSYDEAVHFNQHDMEVMTYISTQVASAIERRRSEEALKESEARFHGLFDNATVGIYRTTPDGRILLSNPAAIRMLGYDSFEELATRNLEQDDIEPLEQRHAFLEYMEREGSISGLESVWRRKDGSYMHVRESATAVRDKQGTILYFDGVFEDITDRKLAEEAAKQSEMFARSIVETEPECVKIVGPDGILEYMNPAGQAMIEVESLDMVRGQSVYPIVAPEHRAAFQDLTERVLRGESGSLQFEMIGLKGTRRWLDTHAVPLYDQQGNVTSLLGITRDITERKQSEALQDAVYRIANAAETTPSLSDLYPQIHQIISSVMPAENFFITLYNEEKNLLSFPYFKDVQDEPYLGQFEPGKGLTAYVLRTGKSLLCTQEVHDELERQGAVKLLGVPSKIWLGVPLMVEGKAIGVMVVQHYTNPDAYGQREQHILEFVSSQVAVAIQRKQAEEALRDSESRYRNLFTGMQDGVYRSTHEGRFVDVNPAMLQLFGYDSREEMLQLDIKKDLYFAPEERESLFLDTGQEKVDVFRMRRKDGREIWVEDHGRYVHDEHGNVLFHEGILRDVTERIHSDREIKRLLQESQQRLRQVEALRSIDLAIGSSMDLRTTLNILLNYIKSLLQVDAADILLFNPNSQSFEFAASTGYRSRSAESILMPMGNSLAGRVALERKMVQFADKPELPANPDLQKTWKNEAFVSYTAAPLIAKGELKGVLEVYHRSSFVADAQWMDLFQNFSIQASIAIDNSQLFNDLQRSNFELSLAYDATIEGWSRALELREYEAVGHAQRLTDLTMELARVIGIRDADMVHLRRGALLHDIGKMGVPDSILLKTTALTETEWEVMRKHPIFAYEMLVHINYLKPALDIPYCHHERWDGSGYPRGLAGEEIPPAARVFAVADAYEAMTSDRIFCKRISKEEAMREVQAQAGKQFDPKVVAAFLQLAAEGRLYL